MTLTKQQNINPSPANFNLITSLGSRCSKSCAKYDKVDTAPHKAVGTGTEEVTARHIWLERTLDVSILRVQGVLDQAYPHYFYALVLMQFPAAAYMSRGLAERAIDFNLPKPQHLLCGDHCPCCTLPQVRTIFGS